MTQSTFDQAVNTFERLGAKPTAEDIIGLSNYLASLASVQDALGSTPPTLVEQAIANPQVVAFAVEGKKIQAIKELRTATGSGLKEAKDAIYDPEFTAHVAKQPQPMPEWEREFLGAAAEPLPNLKVGDRIVVAREGSDKYGKPHHVGRKGYVGPGELYISGGHIGVQWDDGGGDNMPLLSSLDHDTSPAEPQPVEPEVYVVNLEDYWGNEEAFSEFGVYGDIVDAIDYQATEDDGLRGGEWRVLKPGTVEALGEFKPVLVQTPREFLENLEVGQQFGPDRDGDLWKKVGPNRFSFLSKYAHDFVGSWTLDSLVSSATNDNLFPNGLKIA